jgi:ABC-2 type transport system permease protein
MRTALLIAAKDLRQRLRDRSVLIFAVIAPAGLAAIFSLLLGGVTEFHPRYAVADLDGGPMATALVDDLLGSLVDAGVAELEPASSEAEARAWVEDGRTDAALVVPAGFSDTIARGGPAEVRIVGTANSGLATSVARSIAQQFDDHVRAIRLAVHTVGTARGRPLARDEIEEVVASVEAAPPPIALVDEAASLRQLDSTTYFSAAMAILFLFFAAQYGILSLHAERRNGTLARILAGPVHPTTVLLAKAIASFLTGALAMTILVVGTTVALGADWGHPLGVMLVVAAAIVAAVGVTTLVISFTRSEDAAGGAVAAVAISLGILGGTFSPMAYAPELMSRLSLVTPHAWFLRGLGDLHGTSATVTDALPSIAVLLGMGLVTGSLGFARARRLVRAR